ncbi:MAG TPA: hypothetical protein VEF72_11095 [Mycobacterium sp.]|nr:hypothetical protein [Mycobacterium sp.]
MGSKKTAIVAATLVLATCGISAGIANADPPAPPPQPKTTIDHDGTYTVGTDIAPGTYSSAGPVGKGACYWKRLSGPNGSDIVDNAMTKKPQVVQIEPSDKAFKTDGCQPWQNTDSADGKPPGEVPPQNAQGLLQTILGGLNGAAGQSGAGQAPGP